MAPGSNPLPPLPPLPRTVTGIHVREVRQTSCPGHVALVWFDAGPALGGADFEFVDALCVSGASAHRRTGPHADGSLAAEFVRAFAEGVRAGLAEHGGGRPPYATRVVLRRARGHVVDANERGFGIAGRRAAAQILAGAGSPGSGPERGRRPT
jgi:hypothetical protein